MPFWLFLTAVDLPSIENSHEDKGIMKIKEA